MAPKSSSGPGRAQLTEVLDEVVDEAVVVVDDEDAGHGAILAHVRAATRGDYPHAVPQSKAKRSRYTPPSPKKAPPSPLWMAVAITTCLATGLVVVVTNYLGVLPGDAENRYLIVGLVLISTGFMLATNYH